MYTYDYTYCYITWPTFCTCKLLVAPQIQEDVHVQMLKTHLDTSVIDIVLSQAGFKCNKKYIENSMF